MTQAAADIATTSGERANPLGLGTARFEQVPAVTIPEAVRRCRWIALDVGAGAFSLFVVSPSVERTGLVPCFDSDYPRVAPATKFISGASSEELIRHARTSTLPCWWVSDTATASAATLAALDCATQIAPPVPESSGIAFPVYADRSQYGFVVFSGSNISLTREKLANVHARCFSLFAAVARIRADDSDTTPSISKRELECLKLTANGLTSEEIASRLKLSVHTANQYLTNTTQKLNAVNRMHAVAKALRLGLIE